jgi:hypothetical protein
MEPSGARGRIQNLNFHGERIKSLYEGIVALAAFLTE